MKKFLLIFSLIGSLIFAGCSDLLDTDPTDKVSGNVIFSDAENALSAVNGIYRMMYTGGWGTNWAAENGGLPAYILVFDLMAEDHVMDGAGSGWFWYDYYYDTWGDYSQTFGHQYQIWNFFYTLISNANYIIAQEGKLPGDKKIADYVMGQAYAIRSYCYMWLVQCFQQCDPSKPGVPLYTSPTIAGSKGNPRGTVKNVYDQANSDIDKAISLLESSAITQYNKSHIDKYVAYGIKARHALVQKDYATALTFAKKAMESSASIASFQEIRNVNKASAKDVMWALMIQTDQAMGNYDIFNHMDADCKSTYSKARHLISSWLYNQIPDTDQRKQWWTAPLPSDQWGATGSTNGSKRSWCQKKLVYLDVTAATGDHVIMREEEMALIAAEAACHLGKYSEAREYVSMVGNQRDANYPARVSRFTDSKEYNSVTTANIVTLMDEILFQRRVELWSEVPRLHDLQRLGLGFKRNFENSNHTKLIPTVNTNSASPAFILWIPQSEFDGNESLDPVTDQNPSQIG